MPTYWVEADHGGTDSGTESNPWLTIDQAMNVVVAGDKVWVKGGINYTETVTMDTPGNSTSQITFEGYTTTTGDTGQFTIDGGGTRTNGVTGSIGFYYYANMIIDNCTGDGFSTSTSDSIGFYNCEFVNNGGAGLVGDNYFMFANCKFEGNTSYGAIVDAVGSFYECTFANNSGGGVDADNTPTISNCLFYGNSAYSIKLSNSGCVLGCTIDGKNEAGTYGIYSTAGIGERIFNNIIYNLTYGINKSTANLYEMVCLGGNNLLNSNGTDYTGWPLHAQITDITNDPGFVDEDAGDYTLVITSAARNAGADASGSNSPGMDIGAHQSEDEGGQVVIMG